MSDHPLTSIIITTYNRAQHLPDAIDSVLAQTYTPLEVIVVDDGSTDETDSVLARYEGRITAIRQPNSGSGAARNTGIEHARGQFIALLDDDDTFAPTLVEKSVEYLQKHPHAGMTYTSYWTVDLAGNPIAEQRISASGQVYRQFLLHCKVSLSGVMLRREAVEQVGQFDTTLRLGQDRDYWLRMARAFEVGALTEPLAYVRVHPGNKPRDPAVILDAFLHVADKHFPDGHNLGGIFKRRVYARIYFDAGHYAPYFTPDDLRPAWHYWRKGMARWPFEPFGWLLGGRLLFRTLVPNGLQQRIRSLWRRQDSRQIT